jgi:hypothetical protein
MPRDPYHQKTFHHRRPSAWGGERRGSNGSVLPRWEHELWHHLFGMHYATHIGLQLSVWSVYKNHIFVAKRHKGARKPHLAPQQFPIRECMTPVQKRAWRTLRKSWRRRGIDIRNPHAVAAYITKRYLDPNYWLCVRSRSYEHHPVRNTAYFT